MSMTREEAVERLKRLKRSCRDLAAGMPEEPGWALHGMALDMALTALRPVSREQVEKVNGEWEWYDEEVGSPLEGIEREWGWRCSKCKVVLPDDFDDPDNPPAMRFCQWCGASMTDEAVEIRLKELEALYEEN